MNRNRPHGISRARGLWQTVSMAKRALRVVKHLGRIPALAACTVCGATFETPLGALVSVKDAEANLQQQFYGHKCDRKDARQTSGRTKGKSTAFSGQVMPKANSKSESRTLKGWRKIADSDGRNQGCRSPMRAGSSMPLPKI